MRTTRPLARFVAAVITLFAAMAPASTMAQTEESLAVDPALRDQLLAFVPYISMRNKLTLGEQEPATVAAVMEEWTSEREFNEHLFDAHPSLRAAYRDVRSFLVESRHSITPALREIILPAIDLDPITHPELAITLALMRARFEIAKNKAVLSWCERYDAKCRAAYQRILPLLRKAAKGQETNDGTIRIRHWYAQEHGVYLEAVNVSGRQLHNVSLYVRLETLDGASSDHYFFRPVWPSSAGDNDNGHRYTLRLAVDWWPIGAECTTLAIVEVISDELLARGIRCPIDDQVPTAADRIFRENEAQLSAKSRPKVIMNRLERIKGRLGPYPERLSQLNAQFDSAKAMLDTAVAALDAKIEKTKQEIRELERPGPKYAVETREARRKRAKETLAKLEAERLQWLRGER
ncbi:MAG: hypothetical protein KF678_09615 [Phycisphaeraceae bacterium]|nr:hypothetical protein [Phycisphaeraceae bacterium]